MTTPIEAMPTGSTTSNNLTIFTSRAVSRRFLAGGSGLPWVTSGMTELAAFVVTVLPVFAIVIGALSSAMIVINMTITVTASAKNIIIGDIGSDGMGVAGS